MKIELIKEEKSGKKTLKQNFVLNFHKCVLFESFFFSCSLPRKYEKSHR